MLVGYFDSIPRKLEENVYRDQLMAASIVVSLPVVVAFLAMQRHIVGGLTAGG